MINELLPIQQQNMHPNKTDGFIPRDPKEIIKVITYLKIAETQEKIIDGLCNIPYELQFDIKKFLGEENCRQWVKRNFPKVKDVDSVLPRQNRTHRQQSKNYGLLLNHLDIDEPVLIQKKYNIRCKRNVSNKKKTRSHNSEKYEYEANFWNYDNENSESESEYDQLYVWDQQYDCEIEYWKNMYDEICY